jgi:hypothetical protein
MLTTFAGMFLLARRHSKTVTHCEATCHLERIKVEDFVYYQVVRSMHRRITGKTRTSIQKCQQIKSRYLLNGSMRWAGHVARMGGIRNVYNILVAIRKGKRPLGRPRCRREDNIRMDLKEEMWEDVDWMHLAQYREQWRAVVNTIMNLRVP